VGHAFGSLDELGEGYGFRKVRQALGITAFGANFVVYPPGGVGVSHYHDEQDELYFVHTGTARVEVGDEVRELGPGGLCHVESTTPRRISNVGDDDLVVLVIGGKGGYVGRDGQVSDERELERRRALSRGQFLPVEES
jgi:mannose-6-phosphate isomerase-like protein (cupin superfamily)